MKDLFLNNFVSFRWEEASVEDACVGLDKNAKVVLFWQI